MHLISETGGYSGPPIPTESALQPVLNITICSLCSFLIVGMISGVQSLHQTQFGLLFLYCLLSRFVHRLITEDISVLIDHPFKGIADGPLSIQKMI